MTPDLADRVVLHTTRVVMIVRLVSDQAPEMLREGRKAWFWKRGDVRSRLADAARLALSRRWLGCVRMHRSHYSHRIFLFTRVPLPGLKCGGTFRTQKRHLSVPDEICARTGRFVS